MAQNIPVPLTQTRLYDFIDELLTDGIVVRQTAVRPYTRKQIADMLVEAQAADTLLNRRQQKDLAFYLNEFALERDTMVDNHVQYTDHSTYNLSLADPQFCYRKADSMFKMRLRPILGADVMANKKGVLLQRWWGAELQMDIANHLSIWGSLRDNSWSGDWLNKEYYPDDNARMRGARIHYGASGVQPALTPLAGVQYKEANYGGDFSDSKGGISLYSWWGSIGIQRENIRWGDAYHSSNILSGRAPAVPMVSLQLTPCEWFQFDYFHAWLVSNVIDTSYYYLEHSTKPGTPITNYRPMNKFMAANMFTTKRHKRGPCHETSLGLRSGQICTGDGGAVFLGSRVPIGSRAGLFSDSEFLPHPDLYQLFRGCFESGHVSAAGRSGSLSPRRCGRHSG